MKKLVTRQYNLEFFGKYCGAECVGLDLEWGCCKEYDQGLWQRVDDPPSEDESWYMRCQKCIDEVGE